MFRHLLGLSVLVFAVACGGAPASDELAVSESALEDNHYFIHGDNDGFCVWSWSGHIAGFVDSAKETYVGAIAIDHPAKPQP